MLLEQKPTDYGIDRNIWTGKIISNPSCGLSTDVCLSPLNLCDRTQQNAGSATRYRALDLLRVFSYLNDFKLYKSLIREKLVEE